MFLQPQTNEQGKMLGAEALVRWQHPERGLLGSYAFIDVLKIDNGFLRDSENEERGIEILESVVLLAKKIGMKVIVEGVETKEQLLMLMEMGCEMFQGYYFSRPIPVEEFEGTYM